MAQMSGAGVIGNATREDFFLRATGFFLATVFVDFLAIVFFIAFLVTFFNTGLLVLFTAFFAVTVFTTFLAFFTAAFLTATAFFTTAVFFTIAFFNAGFLALFIAFLQRSFLLQVSWCSSRPFRLFSWWFSYLWWFS